MTPVPAPSVLEIIFEENLKAGLRNALEYLTHVLGSNNPTRYRLFHQYFEEIYLGLEIFFQGLYLSTYNSSFSEYFYHLYRTSSVNLSHQKLTKKQIFYSLLSLCFIPYLRSKFDKLYTAIDQDGSEATSTGEKNNLTLRFYQSYPVVQAVVNLIFLSYKVNFAVGKTVFHNPVFQYLGIKLVRGQIRKPSSLAAKLTTGLGYFLMGSAYFIQFLDYWYSREESRISIASLKTPLPPPKLDISNLLSKICPLCKNSFNDEACLRTSGFVFCYKCISNYVEKYHTCPVTGYPTSNNQVVKIYQQCGYSS